MPITLPTLLPRMETLVFVVTVRNAQPYVARCLQSLLAQRAVGWGAVVVDDCSSDQTWAVIQAAVGTDTRFTLVRQPARCGQLYNLDYAVTRCCAEPSAIIAVVDGDDWLAHDGVVDRIRAFPEFDVLWSTHETWPDRRLGISNYLPPRANVREYPWVTSHLRTFRKRLFDRIDKRDFLDADGQYFTMSGDVASMLPLLELAGPAKRYFLDEVLYVYNRETPFNDDKIDPAHQAAAEARIRSRPPYKCLSPVDRTEAPTSGQTGWQPSESTPARVDDVGPELVLLSYDTIDPRAGDVVQVSRAVSTRPGERWRVRLEVRDSYPDDRFPNRIEQQVHVDGRLLWRHDIGEGSFAGWHTVDQVVDATSEGLRVDVRLIAVGDPEPGWRWGAMSQTAIRGFTAERVGEPDAALAPSVETAALAAQPAARTQAPRSASRSEPFVFVVPVFNAASYIGRCLQSVRAQRGPWGAVVVDDCSTDETWSVIERTTAGDPRFTLVRNAERRFPLRNADHAITAVCANPDSVIAVLDGDDWLVGDDVVEIFLRLHAEYDVVWSNNRLHPGGEIGWSNYLPPQADVRRYSWVTSHLRTFKKRLFDLIDKQDFLDVDGRYYSAAGDVAFMLPLLELAGPAKRSFLDEVCCVYNRETALSEDKQQGNRQAELTARIRAKAPYQSVHPLTEEELAARGKTPWEPYGNVPVEFHADGPEFVFFGPAAADPLYGSYAGVRRVVPVQPGTAYVLTVSIRDSYSDSRFGGRFEQQVYVNDELVWRHDLSGGRFAGWNTVSVRHTAADTSATVRVQLTAVGEVEREWNWGELARTLVRGFELAPVSPRSNAVEN